MCKIEVGLDWYTASFSVKSLGLVASALSRYLGREPLSRPGRGGFYVLRNSIWFDDGAAIFHSHDSETGYAYHDYAVVELKGVIASALSDADVKNLISVVRGVGGKATRIDARIDLFHKPVTGNQVYHEHVATDRYTGPAFERVIGGKTGGVTVQFGKRGRGGGLVSVICYDKDKESGGVRDCFRVEACFQKEKANELQNVLASVGSGEEIAPWLGKAVCGAICFYEERVQANGTKYRAIASWWKEVMERLRFSENPHDTS